MEVEPHVIQRGAVEVVVRVLLRPLLHAARLRGHIVHIVLRNREAVWQPGHTRGPPPVDQLDETLQAAAAPRSGQAGALWWH